MVLTNSRFKQQVFPTIQDKKVVTSPNRKRFNISFVGRAFKLNGLFWQSSKSTKIKMALSMFSKEEMTLTMSKDVLNDIGLAGLNKMMLLYSHQEIIRALRIISEEDNHPLMFHCASGEISERRCGIAAPPTCLQKKKKVKTATPLNYSQYIHREG